MFRLRMLLNSHWSTELMQIMIMRFFFLNGKKVQLQLKLLMLNPAAHTHWLCQKTSSELLGRQLQEGFFSLLFICNDHSWVFCGEKLCVLIGILKKSFLKKFPKDSTLNSCFTKMNVEN